MAEVDIDPNVPVKVTIDLQSIHATLFRIFSRPDADSPWTFVKEGSSDSSAVIPQMSEGSALFVEFVFMPDANSPFRAVVVFEQHGEVLATIPETAPGDKVVHTDQIDCV